MLGDVAAFLRIRVCASCRSALCVGEGETSSDRPQPGQAQGASRASSTVGSLFVQRHHE